VGLEVLSPEFASLWDDPRCSLHLQERFVADPNQRAQSSDRAEGDERKGDEWGCDQQGNRPCLIVFHDRFAGDPGDHSKSDDREGKQVSQSDEGGGEEQRNVSGFSAESFFAIGVRAKDQTVLKDQVVCESGHDVLRQLFCCLTIDEHRPCQVLWTSQFQSLIQIDTSKNCLQEPSSETVDDLPKVQQFHTGTLNK
jgi:hypothetical protein